MAEGKNARARASTVKVQSAFLFITRFEAYHQFVDIMVLAGGKSPTSSSIVRLVKYAVSQHVREAVLLTGLPSCVAKFTACLFATFCSKRACMRACVRACVRAYVRACLAHWVSLHSTVQDVAAAAMLELIHVTAQHYTL